MNCNKQGLSYFSLTMLALGSIIGAGMFLGSGLTVHTTGVSVVLAYLILGILMYFILSFLAELSLLDPEQGSFQSYAAKALGPGAGFVIGWLYWVSGIMVMSSEVTAAAIFTQTWFPNVPQWLLVLLFTGGLTAVNLVGSRGFGRVESALAIIKVLALVGFIGAGLFLLLGSQSGRMMGWQNLTGNSLFPGGFSGFAGSLLLVFFAYAGTSVVGLAINESDNPNRTVPRVVLATAVLVTSFYVVSIFLIVALRPWSAYDATTSPFVSALTAYRIYFAQNIMNFVVLTAALSAMSASMYGVSRMLYALAGQGEAPKYFLTRNAGKVPVPALMFSNSFLLVIAVLSYLIPGQLYLLVTGASGLLSIVNQLVITFSHWKLKPKLRSEHKKQIFQAPGYPVANFIAGCFLLAIFVMALAVPDQRPSFLVGLGFICGVTILYFLLGHEVKLHRPLRNR